MKNSIIINFVIALFILTACKQKTQVTVEADGEATGYACPMKCEGEKVYPVAGKCPVCGMDLVALKDVNAPSAYEMRLTTMPEAPEAGKPTKLVFFPKLLSNDSVQVPLDVVHEEKVHVIVVSKDLAWYDHIHPDYQADGSYTIEETFPAGGEYIVFADYHPSGAGNQVQRHEIAVTGVSKNAESFTTQSLTTETDGYTVSLKPMDGKLITNNLIHMGVEITEKGTPVTNLENIMGTKGHLVIISGDGQKYLHVHPDEVDGKLDLHTQFDQPGIYRAYFQFKTKGKEHTSYFTLDVKEGKAGDLKTSTEHSHDHESGDGHDHGEEGHEH